MHFISSKAPDIFIHSYASGNLRNRVETRYDTFVKILLLHTMLHARERAEQRERSYTFPATQTVETTSHPYPNILKAQQRFLQLLGVNTRAEEVSLVETLKLRKKWLRNNHPDRSRNANQVAAVDVTEAWNSLVRVIQGSYKDAAVDTELLTELDTVIRGKLQSSK